MNVIFRAPATHHFFLFYCFQNESENSLEATPTPLPLNGPPNRGSSLQTMERSLFLRALVSGVVRPLIGRQASAHPGKRQRGKPTSRGTDAWAVSMILALQRRELRMRRQASSNPAAPV